MKVKVCALFVVVLFSSLSFIYGQQDSKPKRLLIMQDVVYPYKAAAYEKAQKDMNEFIVKNYPSVTWTCLQYDNYTYDYIVDLGDYAKIDEMNKMWAEKMKTVNQDDFKKYADAFKDDPILGLVPESAIEDKYAYVVIHELGHALGGLADEYGAHNEKDTDPTKLYSNCSPSPFDSFSYQGYIYGNAIKECFLPLSSDHRPMYKPSKNSLMHNQFYGFDPSRASESAKYDSGQRYNIISCAYISEALNLENGKKMTADGAKKYFQACQKMDTVQNGYGTITQPPQIGSIDNKSLKPNQMMMVKITSR